MKLTDFLADIGRPVAFHPGLKKLTKSTTATLFLCQFIYWTGKQADPEGWIYKTSDEIEEETGLTYNEQATARTHLLKLKFIEEEYKRLEHKMVFRIMAKAIDEAWRNLQCTIPESQIMALGKDESSNSLNSNTQTTTENTNNGNEKPSLPRGKSVRKPKPPKEKVEDHPEHRQIFSALARICKLDMKLKGGQIGKTAKELCQAGYHINDLENFEKWWKEKDFRGMKGTPPMLEQVKEKILQARKIPDRLHPRLPPIQLNKCLYSIR